VIDKNKTYRTRDGREVRIYATDGRPPFVVHGAFVGRDKNWHHADWRDDGGFMYGSEGQCDTDLIEVKPRIKREYWVNVYRDGISVPFKSKNDCDDHSGDRVACVRLTIDCEEGTGL
jgi:hypothetical protein